MSRTTAKAFLVFLAPLLNTLPVRSTLLYADEPAAAARSDEARDKPQAEPKFPNFESDNRAYLTDLRLLEGELKRLRDDREWRSAFVQFLGTQQSFLGRYSEALATFDDGRGYITSNASADLSEYEALDAVETLLELADRHQVIMINEAHHVPLHRAFTIGLLTGLYKKGFRYFAAESLTAKDESLSTHGYPTLHTGYYLHEPLCADLVRIAHELGYQVVPYEFEPGDANGDDDLIASQNAREEGQARNLKQRILDKDPQAKILVHAGYAHIYKRAKTWELGGQKGEVRQMALCFQQLTGIEPMSVDQTQFTEHSKPKYDSPVYRQAIERGLLKHKPVILRQGDGHSFYSPQEAVDLAVFHPRTRYERGRPSWLSLGGRRQPHAVQGDQRPAAGAVYLAQAFYAHEAGPDAAPIDQIAYGDDGPLPTLWLSAGKFRVRIVDESGKTLHEYAAACE
jgi:hypothetical protein